MSAVDDVVRRNVQAVRERIALAAAQAGRTASDVTLVAVTKYVDIDVVRAAVAAGCRDLAESRPQELWRKAAALADLDVRWHLVGQLQTNKLRRTLPLVGLMHSLDRRRLLDEMEPAAAHLNLVVPGLIEVNISGDATKHGFQPDDVAAALDECAGLSHVSIEGLMGMASREGDLESARREFASLRELRDRLAVNAPPNVRLTELSMGMSGDYEAAIAEGATLVRVGSRLFEGLEE